MSEALGLKNVNMLSKEQYDGIEDVAKDELYAVAIETYSDADGNWYRVYPDGWCEQGGIIIGTGDINVSFLKPFASTNYTIINSYIDTSSTDSINIKNMSTWNRTTTSFYTRTSGSAGYNKTWFACGYGA